MAVLARVTSDLDARRGPDLMHGIEVPSEWFRDAARVRVRLPRLLPCARCEGGGCDRCERRGAFDIDRARVPPVVELNLPQNAAVSGAVRVRVPEAGAVDPSDAALPRGHLILTVNAGPAGAASRPGVELVVQDLPAPRRGEAPAPPKAAPARGEPPAWLAQVVWGGTVVIATLLGWWLWG